MGNWDNRTEGPEYAEPVMDAGTAGETVRISSPWVGYVHKLEELFGPDPDITVRYDDDSLTVRLYVNGDDKSTALTTLLPDTIRFGNVELRIEVIPSNDAMTRAEMYRRAFEGNPLYSRTVSVQPIATTKPFLYVMFKPEVVQYWDDNLGDPHGKISTLAQEIARDVFEDGNGVYFSTDEK